MKSLKACARDLRAPASDAYLKLFSVLLDQSRDVFAWGR